MHWDHSTSCSVKRGSVACGALELLSIFQGLASPDLTMQVLRLPVVRGYLDAVDVAESWMQQLTSQDSRHLLTFEFLFEAKERALYFRTINHLKMRQAVSSAEKAVALRRRMPLHVLDEPTDQLKYAEETYLLLNVSRTNLLRDAYDQLWQRRQGELLRPLRVRLGEVEELEVGHDLGGVQMEFFNLVCQEAFAEDAQMFTTNMQTGLSYFRPCSLQPLYMFELLGLLLGLAIYNGITLPISLPVVFYRLLLENVMHNTAAESCVGNIKDGWPAESRSLAVITKQDVSDLDFSFPLEANGLRMSVQCRELIATSHMAQTSSDDGEVNFTSTAHGRRASSKSRRTMHVFSAVDERSQPVDSLQGIDWPGWTLARSDMEPESLTSDNKALYVAQYAWWLVQGSVAPQLDAFRRGFYRVVDIHALSLFTPSSLRAFMEGSSSLDIEELRNATKYDGYETKSKYIHTFWRIVSSWPESKQKQLLKFVTAAKRIPIGGASNLTFVIKKTVPEDLEHLPTSSTCFGTLYLPRYANAEALEEKLSRAIEYGLEGFGTG